MPMLTDSATTKSQLCVCALARGGPALLVGIEPLLLPCAAAFVTPRQRLPALRRGAPFAAGDARRFFVQDGFQVQYYDMPRLPGSRIESPDTLGRKCWAFAYLAQFWTVRNEILKRAADVGVQVLPFVHAYDNAIPFTMDLCDIDHILPI